MATLENGKSIIGSSKRGISFEFQSKDLPSRRLLGKGLSGIGYETAWKGVRYTRKDFVGVQRDIFLQEATILVGLKDHENIVKTYGWTVDKRSCSLVLEYMEEDLLSLLHKRMDSKRGVVGKDLGTQSSTFTSTHPVDLLEAVDMMLQIATGVEHLHEQGLAHGDLKTKNILVTHRKDGEHSSKVLKLSDFGLVETKRKSRYIVSRRVRKLDMVRWKSPECLKILSRRLHSSNGDEDETSSESESESTPSSVPGVSSGCAGTKSSDVYSFALICSQILTRQSPYPYLDWKELMFKILSGFRPDLPDSLPPLLRELLISCLGDPGERPSFSTVRMKLKRVQGLLTTAMGKWPQEAAAPSVADSPAHQAAVVPSTEVSRNSGKCLSPKPSRDPAINPSEWTASIATTRRNAPGVPSAASSAPSLPATSAASLVADEPCVEIRSLVGIVPYSESIQSEERLKEASLLSVDQLFSTSRDLHSDSSIGHCSSFAGTSFFKKFVENEDGTSRICDTSATEDRKGTMDTGNVVVPSSAFLLKPFKRWQKTRVLSPQRGRENSKNQWLLRRCLEIPTLLWDLQRGIQTHGAVSESTVLQGLPLQLDLQQGIQTHGAVSRSTVSQGPPLISSCKYDSLSNPRRASAMPQYSHKLAERHRRAQMSENFATLRKLVPTISKNDKVSTLGDAITYLKDLQMQIDELEASKSEAERRYEDLRLSHEALKQRVEQLEASESQVERQHEELKLSHQDLKQRDRQLEAGKFQDDREDKVVISVIELDEQLEALKNRVKSDKNRLKSEFEQLEAWKNRVKSESEDKELRRLNLQDQLVERSTRTVQTTDSMDLHGMLQEVALEGSSGHSDVVQAECRPFSYD